MAQGPFSKRSIVWISALSAVSLLVGLVLSLITEDPNARISAGTDSYSTSAIGHEALVRFLERLDVPVVVSRSQTDRKVGDRAALVILEPDFEGGEDDARRIAEWLHARAWQRLLLIGFEPWTRP